MDIEKLIKDAENQAKELFLEIEATAYFNQVKVIEAFRKNRISTRHFAQSTGYGYDDVGKDALCRVYADVFGAEKAIVTPLLASGTHALTVSLFGLLRPNDEILAVTGNPYDTLYKVINGGESDIGSLKDYGIGYDVAEMTDNGKPDYPKIKEKLLKNKPKLVFITRSGGYSTRSALSVREIGELIAFIKEYSSESIAFVDNCYGEFVEKTEPCSVGADITVGSLIKNPGGGLAPTGGYIVGRSELVDLIANRLTAPSLGMEIGSYNASYLPFFQGFYLAPCVVESALKTGVLAAYLFKNLGYTVRPAPETYPSDIIRAVEFGNKERLISFVQGIQKVSPVDSYVKPEPWDMPGYKDKVIMAAGTFIQGASAELSADSPIREPYIAYFQGSLTYHHGKFALKNIIENGNF